MSTPKMVCSECVTGMDPTCTRCGGRFPPPVVKNAFDPFASVPLADRIAKAIERVTSGSGLMRIPADATDPDLVLVACRERIAELETARDALAKMNADAVVVRDAALDALELMQRALASTMPGVRHIAVQDYAILNDAPVAAATVLREAGRSTPSGT